jgi:drug/metabolite transporter (DMT)-like permease
MTGDSAKQHIRGVAIVTAGVLIISFDALLVRLAAVDGWNVAFWRGAFMCLAMAPFGWRPQHTADQAELGPHVPWMAGAALAASSTSLVLAFTLTRAANAVVILSASPLFAAVLSWLFLGEKCPLRTWAAILVCIGGVTWVMYGSLGSSNTIGDLLAVASAIFIGAYFTIFRSYPTLSRPRAITRGGLLMALIALPMATPLALPWASYGWLVLSGLIQMPLALLLMTIGTRYLPAAEVSLFILLETVLAPIWVWMALGEVPPRTTLTGGGLIVLTLILHSAAGLLRANPIPKATP